MSVAADHKASVALICHHLKGRSATQAGKALYDDSLTLEGNDPRSHVAGAARAVLALHRAGAVGDDKASIALASLTAAYQSVRSLGGQAPH